ncbi:MAG: DUF1570 domain-containing protein [Planctomycetota bacterium]
MGSIVPRAAGRAALAAVAGLLLAGAARADRLVTTDGRVLEVQKARKLPEGGYQLVFAHGELRCPERFVASVEVEGDMTDYVPQNDDERAKLAEGYVRYRGRWFSKTAYQAELNKEAASRRARVEELASHARFADGWEKETKHFVVKTNTSPEILEYYCDLLEAYYDLMNGRVGINPSPRLRRTKMQVNVFKSREEFQEVKEVPPGVAGYFSFLDEELNFYHDYEEPAISNWVALHECTHLLTYLIEPQAWPLIWINEGVADFFGSAEIQRDKRGKLEIAPGKVQVDRVLTVQQAIQDGDYVGLEELFKTEKSAFHAFEYAHAWSFVFFLNNSKYEKGFKRFFKDNYTLPKGVAYELQPFPNQQGTAKMVSWQEVKRLLLKDIGVKEDGVAQLEKEWLDFVAAVPIDAPEARFKRAYWAALGRYDKEEFDRLAEGLQADLDFAIDAGIEDPRAYWARGVLRVMRGNAFSVAEDDFRKAVDLAPLNPSFHLALGQVLGGASFSTGSYSVHIVEKEGDEESLDLRGTAERIEEAKLHHGLAASLEPENEYYQEAFAEFLAAYAKFQAEDK